MTALVRHHTRGCLLFTGACLVVAFSLHDAQAQRFGRPGGISGRPGGISGRTGGFSGRSGGFSGISGGVSGISGGFAGRPGGVIGNPGGFSGMPGGGITGLNPGFPENRILWNCLRCGHGGTSNFAPTFCPECGAALNNGAGGVMPPFNPGFPPAQPVNAPPIAWQPVQPTPEPTRPTTETASTSSGEKSGGLSSKAIIGAGVVALGVFALIGGVVVAMNRGGSSLQKPRRRSAYYD